MHIKDMLAKAKSDAVITPIEARDAMLGCFVTIHGLALQRGAELMGKELDDAGAERHATVIMKGLLGADWEHPTSKRLAEVKERMDQKMRFSTAPEDLKQSHDNACSLIVSKTK